MFGAIALMIYQTGARSSSAGVVNDRKSAVFDRKQTFSDKKMPFQHLMIPVRWACQTSPDLFLIRSFPMIRRKLLVATAIIASVVLAACSDMTAPKNTCPIINGSSTCLR
jgi:hypothetical protein